MATQRRILLVATLLLFVPSLSTAQDEMPDWETWWADNRAGLLAVKEAVKRMEPLVSAKYPSSCGRMVEPTPLEKAIQDELVPALRRIAGDRSMPPRLQGAALVALARSGGGLRNLDLIRDAIRAPPGAAPELRAAAVLSLGVLNQKSLEIRDLLLETADDHDLPARARCFAMISLGLLEENSPEVYECFERKLDGTARDEDLLACVIQSIGLIGDCNSVPGLRTALREGRIGALVLTDLLRSHVVAALGNIGHPKALPELLSCLRFDGPHTRRSAAVAIGYVVPQAAPEAQDHWVSALRAHLVTERDPWVQAYGLIAFGRIGGVQEVAEETREACLAGIRENTRSRLDPKVRAFRELALGLLAAETGWRSVKAGDFRDRISSIIWEDMHGWTTHPGVLRAGCLALGLASTGRPGIGLLLTDILRSGEFEDEVRGSAAIALGCHGDPSGRCVLLKALDGLPADRRILPALGIGAALLGSREMPRRMIVGLESGAAGSPDLPPLIEALGHAGDGRAIAPLLSIAEAGATAGRYPIATRVLAIEALGRIADRRDTPVLFKLSMNLNRPAAGEAVRGALRFR